MDATKKSLRISSRDREKKDRVKEIMAVHGTIEGHKEKNTNLGWTHTTYGQVTAT